MRRHLAVATVFWTTVLWLSTYNSGQVPAPFSSARATIFATADILYPGLDDRAEAVARQMERLLNETPNSRGITMGDNCNWLDGGKECYDAFDRTTWGKLNPRLFPVPGNHEYLADQTMPYYFLYWVNAGPMGVGNYQFRWGGATVLALNSELMARTSDPVQQQRRRDHLAWIDRAFNQAPREQCTVAYFHRPMYSPGIHGSPAWVRPIFQKMYKYNVDLYLTGHDHLFAALPPLKLKDDGDLAVDRQAGVPGLIVGTGGAIFHSPRKQLRWPNDGEVALPFTLGVVRLDLEPGRYRWQFLPTYPTRGVAYPSGSGTCSPQRPRYIEPLES